MAKIVDKDKRKADIARAALGVFSEKGFDAASISRIARVAGIGKGTIYEYFSSKDDLIFHAMKVWIEGYVAGLNEIMDQDLGPEEKLRLGVMAASEAVIADDQAIRMSLNMLQFIMSKSEFLNRRNLVRDLYQEFRRLIVEALLEGVSIGVFRPEIARDAETIGNNLLAFLDGIFFHYFLDRKFIDLSRQVNYYMDRLFESIKPYEKKRGNT